MIKRVLKVAFVVAIAMVAGINVYNSQKTEVLSDVAMANVEALAESEKDLRPSKCWGSGKVDCFTGDKVEYRFFPYGLDDELETE